MREQRSETFCRTPLRPLEVASVHRDLVTAERVLTRLGPMTPAPMIATRIGRSIVVHLGGPRRGIVTGAASGIGEATARLLASRGLDVVLVARRRERLEALSAEIGAAGGRSLVVTADSSAPRAPQGVVGAALELRGRLDVIVNNAATLRLTPIDDVTLEEFDDHVAVNVRAPYFLVQASLSALRASPSPVVVNVSSAAAVMYRRRQTVYGLTKAAVEHLTLNLVAELASDRIRVVCVRPGPVATEIHTAVADPEKRLRDLGRYVPLGRVGHPDEIARWVMHLIGREADWVTGTVFTIDGGRILGRPEA